MWTWGAGTDGRLGLGNTSYYSSPKQVGTLTNWSLPTISLGNAACVKTDGTLWAWGKNDAGSLGQNNTIARSSPVQIGALTTWTLPSFNVRVSGCIQR